MQFQNVTEELFDKGTGGFLSGAPLNRVTNVTFEYGGPILKNRLWFWVNADHQDINTAVLNYYDVARRRTARRTPTRSVSARSPARSPSPTSTRCRNCLNNDKTVIYHVGGKLNFHAQRGAQVPVPDPG